MQHNDRTARWSQGDTLHQIGKLFDRPHTSIQNILAATGGIRPPARHRSRLALTLAEREEISRALAAGESIHCVAARLGRAPPSAANSTVTVTRLRGPTRSPGSARTAPSHANWPAIPPWRRSWRANCRTNGHPSRSQDGSNGLPLVKRICRCPTKPSTARSLSRRAVP